MSASTTVDLGFTTQYQVSIAPANGVASTPASGVIVGQIVDLLNANNLCNVFAAAGPTSGISQIAVQTSDTTTSGSFTDPTSGLPVFPSSFQSGGLLILNSGLWQSGTYEAPTGGVVNNAPLFASGGVQIASFQRPNRYARLVALSGGSLDGPLTAGFISQLKVVGSGAGFSWSPLSGNTVNV